MLGRGPGGELILVAGRQIVTAERIEVLALERQIMRMRQVLRNIDAALRQRPTFDTEKIERRIGRWLGRHPAAERLFAVAVVRDGNGRACALRVEERTERMDWASLAHGAYLLRTNYVSEDPSEIWKWYIQLNHAEASFRTLKSDLALRPIFHQKERRVEAHMLVCFLALVMWRTLELWMASKGLGTCARPFLQEMDRMHSMDILLPTDAGVDLRLRVVSKPEKPFAVLLQRLGINVPQIPKMIENVVQTF